MRYPALVAGCMLAMAAAAHAASPAPSQGQRPMSSSAACESARLSAWFERQRQLTDGDVDPRKQLGVPRECAPMHADADAAKGSAEASAERAAAALAAGKDAMRAY